MPSATRTGPIDGLNSDSSPTSGNTNNGNRHSLFLFDIRISDIGRDEFRIGSRDRLFEVCFMRIALWYSSMFPQLWRRGLEFALLASASSVLVALVYLHLTFVHSPVTCLSDLKWPEDGILRIEANSHAVEYSLEYGLLKLSTETRERLKVPVHVVHLDPESDECFGPYWSRVLQKSLVNTEDALMASLKTLAEKQERRGFVRNVESGDLYRFVNVLSSRVSYLTAALVMFIFTLVITLLLRHSHYQVYGFVASLMDGQTNPPFAPLLTIVLALVGMEAIMAEFFGDTSTAFYVILIVWASDQFHGMCQSRLTRRHWPRFFYLYHFAFYAYEHRFSSQHSGLALLASWLLTLHSMVYFVHRCELPQLVNLAASSSSPSSSSSSSTPATSISHTSSSHQSMQERTSSASEQGQLSSYVSSLNHNHSHLNHHIRHDSEQEESSSSPTVNAASHPEQSASRNCTETSPNGVGQEAAIATAAAAGNAADGRTE